MIAAAITFEDSIVNWLFEHIPTIGTVAVLVFIAVWVTWKVTQTFGVYSNRLVKVEHDVTELKADVKSLKRRTTRIEKKLDKLIACLTTTRQLDKDVLQ
jgi:hypothetical protein